MSDVFDLTNILLLAIAVLIFFRLRSVLGRRTESDRPRLDPSYSPGDPTKAGNVISMPNVDRRQAPAASAATIDDRLKTPPEESRALAPLREIAAADPAFDTEAFLNGAKIAYEMIVTAYAKGDRETLRSILSPEVYDSFNAVISDRERRGETTEFSFVGIESSGVVDAHLQGRLAHVTVRFVSNLVTAIRDRDGHVIEGDDKAVRNVTDVWTFARDVSSPNPNWRLVATDAPEA